MTNKSIILILRQQIERTMFIMSVLMTGIICKVGSNSFAAGR